MVAALRRVGRKVLPCTIDDDESVGWVVVPVVVVAVVAADSDLVASGQLNVRPSAVVARRQDHQRQKKFVGKIAWCGDDQRSIMSKSIST